MTDADDAQDVDEERVRDWIGKGAQPSDSVKRLLKAKGI